MEGDKGVVCVTGGTGFIASWLIMRLLERGYTVHTTVRSHTPESKRDLSYLTNLPGASERLHIFDADLDEPDSFNEAIEGCTGVFHMAHPVDLVDREPEEIVVKRSVEGTLGILRACLNAKTVKRVVYTSSIATISFSGNDQDHSAVDESSWTDIDFCKSLNFIGTSYTAAKTKTERAALEFSDKYGLDVVTVLPSTVLGPFIGPQIPTSVHLALAMIMGNKEQYKYLMRSNMVHTDDVAMAHIFLLESPDAKGRYICSSHELSLHQMSEFLSAKYPDYQIPTIDSLKDIKSYTVPSVSSKKLLDSEFKFKYDLNDMFDGAIRSAQEKYLL